MKAVPRKTAREQPSVPALGKSVLTLLGFMTLVTLIWLMKGAAPSAFSRYAPNTYQPPVLDVALSGTLSTHLRVQDVSQLERTSAGFSFIVEDDIPLLVKFEGSEKAELYDLSDESSFLSVSLLEQGQPYHTFKAFAGSLSYEEGSVRFAARLEDTRGFPLLLSGRLRLGVLREPKQKATLS